jgi:hypothetical protein
MDNFFARIGMFSIAFVIVYGYKKLLDYFN